MHDFSTFIPFVSMLHISSSDSSDKYVMIESDQLYLCVLQFEKTSDHLFEAAYHGQRDAICGELYELQYC